MRSADAGTCSDTVSPPYLCVLPEHALEVGVAEHAVGIEAIADRDEAIPERVALPEGGRGLEVELAPVRAAVMGAHDRLDLSEVGLVLEPVVDMHGDVAGVAGVRRAQRDVVAGHRAHFDLEAT